MKNTKYKTYILPAVLISSALFFAAPASVDAFGGFGRGDKNGDGTRMKMDGTGERHAEMSNMTEEERAAFHEERKAEKEARFESKLQELESAGADVSGLREQKAQVDISHDEFHDYINSNKENYDLSTDEGRQEFKEATSETRDSFRAVVKSFRESFKSMLEQYGLFVGTN